MASNRRMAARVLIMRARFFWSGLASYHLPARSFCIRRRFSSMILP